jgi:hypothetical protein
MVTRDGAALVRGVRPGAIHLSIVIPAKAGIQ